VATMASGRETRVRGNHRTEVTEVTEGESALWSKVGRWTLWLQGEKRGYGGSSHRGHEGHRGGISFVVKSWSVDTVASGRETRL
jgi:hypothetical protein